MYRMKKRVFGGIVFVAVVLILSLPCITVLSISNRKNPAERIYSIKAAKTGFSINYTHSVNKGRVHDYYRMTKDRQLEVYKTVFVSYGAGIPEASETEGAVFHLEDDGYAIENLNRVIPRLVMAVGVVAEHSLTLENHEFFLKDFFKPQTSLVFTVGRVSLLGYVITKKLEA